MTLELVIESLLTINQINHSDLLCSLDKLIEYDIDFSDLYFQSNVHESWALENRILKSGNYYEDQGLGVRSIKGEMTGFAYADQISLNSLRNSVNIVSSVMNPKKMTQKISLIKKKIEPFYPSCNPLKSCSSREKIDLLYRVDHLARSIDHRVKEVNAYLTSSYEKVLVISTDSDLAIDIRPLVQFSIEIVVEDRGKRECSRTGGGSRSSYDFFYTKDILSGDMKIDHWTKEAVRIALLRLDAKIAPAGTFPVILGSGWPGVLLHEAIGHGLEGDFNRKGTSVFTNMIQQKVTSELCTIVDDGTLQNQRGSLNIDDEGTPGQYNVLIENGILKKYMQDKLNARLMNTISTGNGRRESYSHIPIPRMTNTYMLPGISKIEDMIQSVDYGIYAVNFSSGQVDITSGQFVFSTSEAYLIKKGKIVSPIKNTMLIGSGIEVMKKISMVGNDLKMDEGTGICGKDGQNVPVGIGQPAIKVDQLTVGGAF